LAALIQAQAVELDLIAADAAWGDAPEPHIARLASDVVELEQTLIPHGLHVLGVTPTPAERVDLLVAMGEASHGARPDAAAVEALVRGAAPDLALACAVAPNSSTTVEVLRELAAIDRLLAEDHEIPAIVRALDARFVRPAPGGDLLRTPAVLPTGRNLHGFDPFRIPSVYAMRDGARQAERLLERHRSEGHGLPESIALVLWGTDNMKSEGGPIAQALAL